MTGKVRSSFAFLAVTGLSEETTSVSGYISQSRALPSTQNDCVGYLVQIAKLLTWTSTNEAIDETRHTDSP